MDDLERDAARVRAQLDQTTRSARNIAEIVSAYHQGLIAGGLDQSSAVDLMIAFQDAAFNADPQDEVSELRNLPQTADVYPRRPCRSRGSVRSCPQEGEWYPKAMRSGGFVNR
jgi:hypothetical protein